MLELLETLLVQAIEVLCICVLPVVFGAYAMFATVKKRRVLTDETTSQFLKPHKHLKTKKEMLDMRTWFQDTPEGRKMLAEMNRNPEKLEAQKPQKPSRALKSKLSPKATTEKDGHDNTDLTPIERAVEELAARAMIEGKFTYSKRWKKWVGKDIKIDATKISQLLNDQTSKGKGPVLILDEKALKKMEQQAKEETLSMPRASEDQSKTEKEE